MTAGRVDSHHHFWRPERGDYHWMSPDDETLWRDYGPAELRPHLERNGIAETVLVQAAETLEETQFLVQLAAETEFVKAVVGWIDMTSEDALGQLDTLARNASLRGIRPMIQDEPDDTWMLQPRLGPVLENLAARSLAFDALVLPRHLDSLLVLLGRHPELSVVIDHGAKPPIRGGAFEPWAGWMRRLARETRACCKLSGLVTEAGAGWSVADLRPWVDHLLDVFGPERLMWGSDWPVCNLAGGYDAWSDASTELLRELSTAEQRSIYRDTARRFYGL
jgi:L-fuconolactonase